MRPLLLAATALSLAACQTIAPASRKVDPETRPNCERACGQVGMRLTGIVFVSEIGGCVCEPAPTAGEKAGAASSTVPGQGASASAGMAVILAEQQRAQQQQTSSPMPTSPPAHH